MSPRLHVTFNLGRETNTVKATYRNADDDARASERIRLDDE